MTDNENNLAKDINVPHKEQMIIDGVDVSGCSYYQYNMCTATKDDHGDCSLCCQDYDMNDCYYKQLKRKEQSEAKLVKQLQTICDFINNRPETFKGVYGGVDKIITEYAERKEQECERLKEEVSLLKESNSKLQQIEDVNSLEKCYLQQLDQLKAENEQLKQYKTLYEKTRNLWNKARMNNYELLDEIKDLKDSLKRTVCQSECYRYKEA